MTHDYQIVNNETLNPKTDVLTFIWKCDPIDDGLFQYTHRNITINDGGNPVLRIYLNETKHLYKNLYNGTFKVPQDGPASSTATLEVFSSEGNKVFEFDNATKTISTKNCSPGIGVLQSVAVNNYIDLSQFTNAKIEDKDLIVIVEEAPILTKVEWNFENPLYVEPKSDTKLEFKLTYSNGDIRTYVDNSFLRCLHVTNRCYGNIENGIFKCDKQTEQKGVTYITFTDNNSFGAAILPSALKVIICNNREFAPTVDSQFEWNMHQTIDLDDDDNKLIIEEIIVGTEPLIKHDRFKYITLNAYNPEIISLDENRIITNKLGSTVITFNSTFIDFDYYMDLFNIDLQWSIRVIKSANRVEWSISHNELNVTEEAQIVVKLFYNDGTYEDISRQCSYKYDSRFIEIKDNDTDSTTSGDIIFAKAPGLTEISLVSESIPEDIPVIPESIKLTIIQPITKMTLSPTELEMIIGEEQDLKLKYEPDNATPVPLTWLSTEPDVVSVDDKGHIKALSRGSSDILIMIEREDNSEAVDPDNPDKESEYKNKNIYLPDDLYLTTKTDEMGTAAIVYGTAMIYSLALRNKTENEFANLPIIFTTHNSEHTIEIDLPENYTLKYGETITGEVTNLYNKKVKGIKLKAILHTSELENEILETQTDKTGKFSLSPLNVTSTKDGIAIIDDIKVTIKKHCLNGVVNGEYVSDVIVNHKAAKELELTLNDFYLFDEEFNYELDIAVTTNDDDEYTKPITDIHINVIANGVLVYSDYVEANITESGEDLRGKVTIDSFNEVEYDSSPSYRDTEIIDDEEETNNLVVYNPMRCAVCSVLSKAIEVEKIEFDVPSVIVDTEVEETYVHVKVTPENATYPEVTVKVVDEKLAKVRDYGDYEYWIDAIRVGNTKIIATSVDNPDCKAECDLTVTSSKVQEVKIITSGNDDHYEFYDSLNEKVSVDLDSGKLKRIGERVTDEKYDDDDFERFYVPVNNSLQLEAQVLPEDAADTKIKWLSSDSSLVKVNDKGIVTALRQGKQELDVYAEDDISETAFANTAWITAMNPRYNKYDICQVRVTRNKIVAINVDKPDEHDTDEDDIVLGTPWTGGGQKYGQYDLKSEHEQDYIIHVGETVEIPVSVDVQDTEFGTSDNLKWDVTKNKMWNVIEIRGGSPNHANAYDDDFNWDETDVKTVNENKNDFVVKVTGVNIGDAEIYARPYDNIRKVTDKQLYVDKTLTTQITDETGNVKFGDVTAHLQWFSSVDDTVKKHYKLVMAHNKATSGMLMERLIVQIRTADGKIVTPKTTIKNGKDGIIHHYRKLDDGTYEEGLYISLDGALLEGKENTEWFNYEKRLSVYVQTQTHRHRNAANIPVYVTTLNMGSTTLESVNWINNTLPTLREGVDYHKSKTDQNGYAIIPTLSRDETDASGYANVNGFNVFLSKNDEKIEGAFVEHQIINNQIWKTMIWLPEKYSVKPESGGNGTPITDSTYVVKECTSLNVRDAATIDGKVVGALSPGNKVEVITIQGNWAKIPYEDTKGDGDGYAWVSLNYLEKAKESSNNETENTEKKNFGYNVTITNWNNEPDYGQHIYIWDQEGNEVYIEPLPYDEWPSNKKEESEESKEETENNSNSEPEAQLMSLSAEPIVLAEEEEEEYKLVSLSKCSVDGNYLIVVIENARTIYSEYEIEMGVNNMFDLNYLSTTGLPIKDAQVSKTAGNEFIIRLPNEFECTFNTKAYTITDKIVPFISPKRATADEESTLPDAYVILTLTGVKDDEIGRVILSAPTKNKNKAITTKTWQTTYDSSAAYDNLFFPADKTDNALVTEYESPNPLDATPGKGEWMEDNPISRIIKIRVVASPKKFRIGWCNPWNDQLYSINEIYDGIYRDRWSKNKHRFLAIGWDDDFQELLNENDALNLRELDEKYKSFAWFSDNEEVVRFVDCPMGVTYDNKDEYYNDPDSITKKGTTDFKVKGSWIKEIICEGRGRANIYILNTKGQVMKRIPVRIK